MTNSIGVRDPTELLIEIANTLASAKSAPHRIWICEGPDDADALRHHDPDALVFAAGKRDAVIAAADALSRTSRAAPRWRQLRLLLLGLVDRDYHGDAVPDRVRVTSSCSLEADLLLAGGGEVVRRIVVGIEPTESRAMVELATRLADSFGALRSTAFERRVPLRMKGFPVCNVIASADINWSEVRLEVERRHPEGVEGLESCLVAAKERRVPSVPPGAKANGHDLVQVLCHLISGHPKMRGQVSTREVWRALVTSAESDRLEWLAA